MNIIEAKNLTFAYEENTKRHVIENMSFGLKAGTVTVLTGLSGCGKSTLCQILCGIIPEFTGGELTGTVMLEGKDMTMMGMQDIAKKVGYVMQDPDRQIIASTVEDELAFAPENLCIEPKKIRSEVERVMDKLGITGLALKNPGKLSGGEKQITAIASVLTLDPDIVIMDEPFSFLDEKGRRMVCEVIEELKREGKTILVVLHDTAALPFADKRIHMGEEVIYESYGK